MYSRHESLRRAASLTSLVAWFPTTAAPYLPCFKYCPLVLQDKRDTQLQNRPRLRVLSAALFFRSFPTCLKGQAAFLSLKTLQLLLPCLSHTLVTEAELKTALFPDPGQRSFYTTAASNRERILLLRLCAPASVLHKEGLRHKQLTDCLETAHVSGQHPRLRVPVMANCRTCSLFDNA